MPLRSKDATTVAKALVNHVFLKWGLCHEILTDQGPEFEAELLNELLKILGVVRLRTSGFRPQSNGAVEMWHRTLNSMFAKVIAENQKTGLSGFHLSHFATMQLSTAQQIFRHFLSSQGDFPCGILIFCSLMLAKSSENYHSTLPMSSTALVRHQNWFGNTYRQPLKVLVSDITTDINHGHFSQETT